MDDTDTGFTPEERARLAVIWERLFELYLAEASATPERRPALQTEIDDLIRRRNEIRDWGWSTGKDAGKDRPKKPRAA